MYKLIFLFHLLVFSCSIASPSWHGSWIALDEWQSEYAVEINEDGTATSDYGNGESGTWDIKDGNLEIRWDSGKIDYWFNGVMGFQRLSKSSSKTYTSGLRKKLLDKP
jgi:hypothetical protein